MPRRQSPPPAARRLEQRGEGVDLVGSGDLHVEVEGVAHPPSIPP